MVIGQGYDLRSQNNTNGLWFLFIEPPAATGRLPNSRPTLLYEFKDKV